VVEGGFDLDAGMLCLDFANTLDMRFNPQPNEGLPSYAALIAFAAQAGAIDHANVSVLAHAAMRDERGAHDSHQRAIELREVIFRIFMAIADDRTPDDADLAQLNRALADALPHGGVEHRIDVFVWEWESATHLDRPLWPIVKSAADLLLGQAGDLRRVRECAAHDCGWLFLDTSRNRSRRWCSMQSCGNRAKVQEFRERRRGAGGEESGKGKRESQ